MSKAIVEAADLIDAIIELAGVLVVGGKSLATHRHHRH